MKLQPKFRPSFTSDMIREIYSSLSEGETKEYLKGYIVKIDHNLIQPNYVNTGLRSSSKYDIDSLGFSQSDPINPINHIDAREQAYNEWLKDPLQVSEESLQLVQTYRYENDLMNEEESNAFESNLFSL